MASTRLSNDFKEQLLQSQTEQLSTSQLSPQTIKSRSPEIMDFKKQYELLWELLQQLKRDLFEQQIHNQKLSNTVIFKDQKI